MAFEQLKIHLKHIFHIVWSITYTNLSNTKKIVLGVVVLFQCVCLWTCTVHASRTTLEDYRVAGVMSKPDLVRPTKSGGTCAGVVANGLWVCFVLCLVIRHCSGSDDTRVNAERDRVAPPGWRLLWRDDFDGAQGSPPSALRWTARDNMTHGCVNCWPLAVVI